MIYGTERLVFLVGESFEIEAFFSEVND